MLGLKLTHRPPGQNRRQFVDIFKCISMNEKYCILIPISLKFVPKGLNDTKTEFIQVVAWRRTGDKPLPEVMLIQFNDAYMRHEREMSKFMLIKRANHYHPDHYIITQMAHVIVIFPSCLSTTRMTLCLIFQICAYSSFTHSSISAMHCPIASGFNCFYNWLILLCSPMMAWHTLLIVHVCLRHRCIPLIF